MLWEVYGVVCWCCRGTGVGSGGVVWDSGWDGRLWCWGLLSGGWSGMVGKVDNFGGHER